MTGVATAADADRVTAIRLLVYAKTGGARVARRREATRDRTSARAGCSGCPGGVAWSTKQSEEITKTSVASTLHLAWSARLEHRRRALPRPQERLLERDALRFQHVVAGARRHLNRLLNGDCSASVWFRHLGTVPASRLPVPVGLDVKREQRVPGQSREPHGSRLNRPRRPSRTIDGEGRGSSGAHVTPELRQSASAAARTSSPARSHIRTAR